MTKHLGSILLACLLLLGSGCASSSHSGTLANLRAVESSILARTNNFRAKSGRHSVKRNRQLTKAAKSYAGYMARKHRSGHYADRKDPGIRAEKKGYDYSMVSENVAWAYKSVGFGTEELAEEFFSGWRESKGHRENMLDPDVTDVGIGVAYSKKHRYYHAVQMFGVPQRRRPR